MNAAFCDACWLMKNSVPFHVAFGMSREDSDVLILHRTEKTAMSIVFGEMDGARFNWNDFAWEKRE